MSIIRQNFGSFGDSANWVTDPYGNAQEKTLSAGDTSITFDILDNTDSNCYVLCIATASAATPNTQPPKSTATVPTYGTSSISGRKTVTYPITAVTSAQAGSKCRLLMVSERSTDYGGLTLGGNDGDIEVGVEKYIGTFTIDGTTYKRYKKVIKVNSFDAPPSGGTYTSMNVPHNIVGVVGWLYMGGTICYQGPTVIGAPLPYLNPTTFNDTSNTNQNTGVYANGDNIIMNYRTNVWSNNWFALVNLEYYKA